MAVFRVEKNKGYTVMSNHHLRNKDLTLKAKGLLSQILSLPENWDYTLQGLSVINREKIDAIRTAIWELETAGYIVRQQTRDEKGKMAHIEYTIYEQPQTAPPVLKNPILENPTQLNKELLKTDKLTTDLSNTHQSIYPAETEAAKNPRGKEIDRIDKTSAIDVYRDIIKDNIEYDILCTRYDPERMTEILELILETVCSTRKTIRIGGEDFPAEVVKSRFMKLGQFHIEYIFDCIDKNATKIYNIRSYLLTTLYNAPATMGHYYAAEVNHDFYGGD